VKANDQELISHRMIAVHLVLILVVILVATCKGTTSSKT